MGKGSKSDKRGRKGVYVLLFLGGGGGKTSGTETDLTGPPVA